jgi:predicted metal-binding membrane protein
MPMDAHMTMRAPPIGALVLMWWLMMAAMMLPSAAPAILLYARMRHSRRGDRTVAPSWVFLSGYLAVWLLFSTAAASLQSLLTGPSTALDGRLANAALLIAAGLYQLSPIKSACLHQCRSPAQFLSRYWRPGSYGALLLGLRQGAYCFGCCWMLMALLFVGGVMNVLWIAGLTTLVAAEKLLPHGKAIARLSSAALISWGCATLLL